MIGLTEFRRRWHAHRLAKRYGFSYEECLRLVKQVDAEASEFVLTIASNQGLTISETIRLCEREAQRIREVLRQGSITVRDLAEGAARARRAGLAPDNLAAISEALYEQERKPIKP